MSNSNNSSSDNVVAGLVGLVGVTVGTILKGFVMVKYWVWFVVPTFGVPEIRMIEAIGIAALIGLVTKNIEYKKPESNKGERVVEKVISSLSFLVVALAMGWILSKFM